MRLYVNGAQVGSRETSAPLIAEPGPTEIGAGAGGRAGFFSGDLDEVASLPARTDPKPRQRPLRRRHERSLRRDRRRDRRHLRAGARRPRPHARGHRHLDQLPRQRERHGAGAGARRRRPRQLRAGERRRAERERHGVRHRAGDATLAGLPAGPRRVGRRRPVPLRQAGRAALPVHVVHGRREQRAAHGGREGVGTERLDAGDQRSDRARLQPDAAPDAAAVRRGERLRRDQRGRRSERAATCSTTCGRRAAIRCPTSTGR